ncbi:FAD-dependent oxidoreductase [Desulfitibacter alkalitolerans]|uniref:FAD-dependent oxidoreductase n=1 Tax=Desulfitibacter alkalitolerans TaxID=264641 RepID=UPI000488BE97|nr:FAD-binding protein [Desulfitibacter alkalitolerans]
MYSTDVLVVGAGMGGMLAAKTAAEAGQKVILVDKARAGTSGPTAFAAGDFLCWVPEEDSLQEWVNYYLEIGEGINIKNWVIKLFETNYEIIKDLDHQGYYIEKNSDGSYMRRGGRGKITKCVLIPTYRLMQEMRKDLIKMGIKILDRVQITKVVKDEADAVCGVMGFNIRNGESILINAKSTVLAAGGCSYRGPFFGQDVVSGEGLIMAFEAGADLAYMEYGNHFNVSLKAYDTYGQSKFMAHGGKYINKLGESFLDKSGDGSRASGHIAVRKMVEEVEKGSGPVYLDLRDFTEKDLVKRLMPNLDLLLQNSTIDFYGAPNEAIPGLTGTSNASSAGVLIDDMGRTSVKGLYAAGDNASKGLVTGACVGLSGVSLAWANVTGHLAGKSAAAYARSKEESTSIIMKNIEINEFHEFKGSKGSINPREVIWKLSEIMGNGYVSIVKSQERLDGALDRCRGLERILYNDALVNDYHDLMLWHEAKNALNTARLTLNASIYRRETRGGHYREDYPQRDMLLDNNILVVNKHTGESAFNYLSVQRGVAFTWS